MALAGHQHGLGWLVGGGAKGVWPAVTEGLASAKRSGVTFGGGETAGRGNVLRRKRGKVDLKWI